MESNQLLEELGRAVDAAKPAQEYCLLVLDQRWWSCLTKAEWSGWMQALGAVAALGIAIWVSGSQERSEKRSAVLQARNFAQQLVIGMQALYSVIEKQETANLKLIIACLGKVDAISQSIRGERLPVEAMHALMNLKLQTVQVLTAAQAFEARVPAFNKDEKFLSFIKGMAELVNPEVAKLHKKMNGVDAENFNAKVAADEFIKASEAVKGAAARTI